MRTCEQRGTWEFVEVSEPFAHFQNNPDDIDYRIWVFRIRA